MARPRPATFDKKKIVAEKRRARFDYFIEDVFEAGIALQGTEVKALRGGEAEMSTHLSVIPSLSGSRCCIKPSFCHSGHRFYASLPSTIKHGQAYFRGVT